MQRALALFELIEKHAHDGEFGNGYVKSAAAIGQIGPEARLSDKRHARKKSATIIFTFWKLTRICIARRRIRWWSNGCMSWFRYSSTASPTRVPGHLHHFFNEEWLVRSDTYTFGHDIEASWLLVRSGGSAGRSRFASASVQWRCKWPTKFSRRCVARWRAVLRRQRRKIIGCRTRMLAAGGGAIVGSQCFQLSGQPKYVVAAERVWDYVERNLIDRMHGEWFWRINDRRQTRCKIAKMSEWKGPYHVSRACLETMRRLISHGASSGNQLSRCTWSFVPRHSCHKFCRRCFSERATFAADNRGAAEFRKEVRPLLEHYCFDCHADGANKGNVAFDEFKTDQALLADQEFWLHVLKNLRAGLMPPQKNPNRRRKRRRGSSNGLSDQSLLPIHRIPTRAALPSGG